MAKTFSSSMDKLVLAREIADTKYKMNGKAKQIYNCPVCGPKIKNKINMMIENGRSRGIAYTYSDIDWLINGGIEELLCNSCKEMYDQLLKQKLFLDSLNQVIGKR